MHMGLTVTSLILSDCIGMYMDKQTELLGTDMQNTPRNRPTVLNWIVFLQFDTDQYY